MAVVCTRFYINIHIVKHTHTVLTVSLSSAWAVYRIEFICVNRWIPSFVCIFLYVDELAADACFVCLLFGVIQSHSTCVPNRFLLSPRMPWVFSCTVSVSVFTVCVHLFCIIRCGGINLAYTRSLRRNLRCQLSRNSFQFDNWRCDVTTVQASLEQN